MFFQFSNPWPSGWRPPPVAPRCSPLSSTSTRPHRCRCLSKIQDIQIPKITKAIPGWVEFVNSQIGGPWGVLTVERPWNEITTLRIPMTGDISNCGTMRQLLSLFSRPLSWQRNIWARGNQGVWIGVVKRIWHMGKPLRSHGWWFSHWRRTLGQNMGSSHHCRRSCRIPAGQTAQLFKLRSWNSSKFHRNSSWIYESPWIFVFFCVFFLWLSQLSQVASLATSSNLLRRQKIPQPSALLARGRLRNTESWRGRMAMGLEGLTLWQRGWETTSGNPGPTRPRGSAQKRHDHPTQPETKVGSWRSLKAPSWSQGSPATRRRDPSPRFGSPVSLSATPTCRSAYLSLFWRNGQSRGRGPKEGILRFHLLDLLRRQDAWLVKCLKICKMLWVFDPKQPKPCALLGVSSPSTYSGHLCLGLKARKQNDIKWS